VITADYIRHAKPTWRDNVIITTGIIVVGFPLFLVGGIMSLGIGNSDIVVVRQELSLLAWGFNL
jgi:cytosine permease|tara:strand:+ start:460 stop:651 length:192 start_codon:yes stop_codon:yes gene_type:complete